MKLFAGSPSKEFKLSHGMADGRGGVPAGCTRMCEQVLRQRLMCPDKFNPKWGGSMGASRILRFYCPRLMRPPHNSCSANFVCDSWK